MVSSLTHLNLGILFQALFGTWEAHLAAPTFPLSWLYIITDVKPFQQHDAKRDTEADSILVMLCFSSIKKAE